MFSYFSFSLSCYCCCTYFVFYTQHVLCVLTETACKKIVKYTSMSLSMPSESDVSRNDHKQKPFVVLNLITPSSWMSYKITNKLLRIQFDKHVVKEYFYQTINVILQYFITQQKNNKWFLVNRIYSCYCWPIRANFTSGIRVAFTFEVGVL